jgi:outer membrane protein, heavy metal efflux system
VYTVTRRVTVPEGCGPCMWPVSQCPRERQPIVLVVSSYLRRRHLPAAALLLTGLCAPAMSAQDTLSSAPRADVLSLRDARAAALHLDPGLRAAREAVAAAAARERQAAARANPTLSYGHEQTSRGAQSNAQDIAQIEWPLDLARQRASRIAAARFRREAADARLTAVSHALETQLLMAYVEAVSATHRVQLAEAAFRTASEAQRVSDERVRAGDAAGYAGRRLRLEAGRYAARRADAVVQARAARERLALLTGVPVARIAVPTVMAADSTGTAFAALLSSALGAASDSLAAQGNAVDALVARALANRAELRSAQYDAEAALADARLAARERVPQPAISAGYKGERVQSGVTAPGASLYGFVAGFSVPLPFLDRRGGAVAAADATARQMAAEADALRRRVSREVLDALSRLHGAEAERAALQPFAGAESRVALRAVQAAYAEGEITLTEWLEAVRAWQETELTLLTLTTDIALRRAELARVVGLSLFTPTESHQ